ncbi:MAG: hypothetical protein R3Y56_03010 [Akkermansia sp.]
MKLHLPKSLRAALLACLSVISPVAATLSTGTLIAGAITYSLLAPQAQASNTDYYIALYMTNGNFLGSGAAGALYAAKGEAEVSPSYTAVQADWYAATPSSTENNRLVFANASDYKTATGRDLGTGSKTIYYDASDFAFAGLTVMSGATGYSLTTAALGAAISSTRNVYLYGDDTTDPNSNARFEIYEDFTFSNTTSQGASCHVYLAADVDIFVAADKTFTMSGQAFQNYGEGDRTVTVTGAGIFVYNTTTITDAQFATTTNDWVISTGATVDMSVNDLVDFSKTIGTGAISIDNGTLKVMSGASIANAITIGSGGAKIQSVAADGTATLTLSGSLTYNASSFGSLSVAGAELSLAEGFSVDLGTLVSNGDYYIITDLGNASTDDLLAFLNDSDNPITVAGITAGQTAAFVIDGTSIKLTISGEAPKTVTSIAGGGTWSVATTWGGESFNDGDAVVIGENGGGVITLDVDASIASLIITGTGNSSIIDSGAGATIVNVGSTTIDATGETTIGATLTTTELNISAGTSSFTNVTSDVVNVSGGSTNLTGVATDALNITGGSVTMADASNKGTVNVTAGSLTYTAAIGDANTSNITLNKGVNLTFEQGFDLDSDSLTIATATSAEEAGTITLGADSFVESISLSQTNAVLKVEKMDGVSGDVTLSIYGGAKTAPSGTEALRPAFSNYTVSVGEGVIVSDNSFLYLNGGDFLITGGGTYKVSAFYGGVSGSTTDGTATTVEANTTFEITGTNDVASGGYYPSFWFDPNTTYDNSIAVYGTFITNSAIISTADGATITVYSGGTYQMNRGTIATTSAASNLEIEIQSGATLALGNQDDGDTSDYASEANITLKDGATLTGTGGVVTTYHSFIYGENATVNFLAKTGDTLIVKGDVAADIKAEGTGTVEFSTVTFNGSIVNAGTMNLNGAVTFTATSATITNTGTLSLGVDGTLTVGAEQSLALTGGTIDLSKASQIINNGTMTLDSSVIFNITDVASTDWVLDTTSGTYTLQLISGNAVDLSSLDVSTNLVGIDSTLANLQFNSDGSLSYTASLDTYYCTGGSLTWVVEGSGFVNAEGTAMDYVNDKDVIFTTADASAILGGIVEADSVTIRTTDDGSGINVSLTGGDYTLDCADIIILGESSLTLTDDALSSTSKLSSESSTTSSIIFNGADVDFGDYGALVADYEGNVVLTAGTLTLGALADGKYEFASLSTADGTLTVNGDLDLDSMSLVSAVTTFNGAVTVAGELNMVTPSGDHSANNDFNGAVTAGSITMQYGTLDFYSTVDVGSISLLGGIINFADAVVATGDISIGDTTTVFTSTVNAASITVSNGTATFKDAVTATTVTSSGGTAIYGGTVNVTSVVASGGTTTFNGAVNVSSVNSSSGTTTFNGAVNVSSVNSSSGTTTFNETVTATGALTIGSSVSTVTFNSTGNTFTNISLAGNNGSIALGDNASLTITNSQSTGNHISYSLAEGSVINFNETIGIYGGSRWTITGDTENGSGGTINFENGLKIGTVYSGTDRGNMTVGQYATVNVKESLSFGADTFEGNLTVNGNFNSEAAISLVDGASTITVGSTGVLTLAKGLTATQTVDTAGLTVTVDGVLQLGNQADDTDYTSTLTSYSVIMNTGSTLKAYATDTTVSSTLSFADSAIVKLLADDGFTLTLASVITAETSTINIQGEGTVKIAGGASVSGLTVDEDASLELSSAVTVSTTLNVDDTATLTLSTGATLSLGASVTSTGTITMNGGSLSLAGTSLTNDLVVTAEGGSLSAGDLELDGSITYNSTSAGIDLTGVTGTITLGDGFDISLFDTETSDAYVIFTGVTDADALLALLEDAITDINGTDVIWTNTNGTITVAMDTAGVLYFNGTDAWLDTAGEAGTWDATSRLVVVTSAEDSYTIDANDVSEVAVASLTLEGEGAVTLQAAISASKIALEGGTLGLSGEAASLIGDITMSNASDDISLSTTGMTIVANSDDATVSGTITDGSLTSSSLTGATIANATVTVGGTAELTNVTFEDTAALAVTLGNLTIDTVSYGGELLLGGEGASLTVTGGESVVGTLFLSAGQNGEVSMTIDANATLTVTDSISLSKYRVDASTSTDTNTVSVNGTLVSNSYLSSNDGQAEITVYGGGTLQLDKGLMSIHYNPAGNNIHGYGPNSIIVQDQATLVLGNQEAYYDVNDNLLYDFDYDYSSTITSASNASSITSASLTMQDGSTLKDNGVDATTTVYQTINFADNATVTLASSSSGHTLVMDKAITGTNISLVIGNNVALSNGATLAELSMQDGATLDVTGNVTTSSLTGSGNITVNAESSLSFADSISNPYTGSLTMNGGTLSATDGVLGASVIVAAGSTLAGDSSGALQLNGSISYAGGTINSLDLSSVTSLTLSDAFVIDLTDFSLEETSYTVFTGLSSDITGDTNFEMSGYDADAYQITWNYEGGTLSFSVVSWGAGTWDSTTGYIMGNDIANANVAIDTTGVTGATLYVRDDESSTMNVGGLTISGTDALSIESVDDDDLSVAGAITIDGTAVTTDADITAKDGIEISNDGSLTLDSASLTETSVTLNDTSSLVAGNITLTGGSITADANTVLAVDTLTSAAIAGSTVSVSGNASLADSSIDKTSTLEVSGGKLTMTGTSSIAATTTIVLGASITMGESTMYVTGDNVASAEISLAEGGSISANKLDKATLSNVGMQVGSGLVWNDVTIASASALDVVSAQSLQITGALQLNGSLNASSGVTLDFAEGASLGISTALLSDTSAALTVGNITSDSDTLAISIDATALASAGLAADDSYILLSSTTALSEDWVYTLNGESSITVNGLIVSLEYDASNQLNLVVSALSGDTWDGNPGSTWSSSANWVAGLTGDTNYLFTGLGLTNEVDVDIAVNADLIMVNITEDEQDSYIFSSSTGDTLTTKALSVTSGGATIDMGFEVTGAVTVESKGSLVVTATNGSLSAGSLAVLGADKDGSAGSFENAGKTTVSGAMTVAAGASAKNTKTLKAGSLELAGSYNNTGTTTVTGAMSVVAGASLSNVGTLTAASLNTAINLSNAGTLTVTGAMTVGDGLSVSNSGALSVGHGSNVASITMDAADSTLTILEGTDLVNSNIVTIGSLTGTGTLIAEAYTEVTIAEWDPTVTVQADALASVMITKINGTDDGSLEIAENGQVTITAGDEGVTFGDGYSSSGILVVVGTGGVSFEGDITEGGSVVADSLTVETGSFTGITVQYLELTSLTNVTDDSKYVLSASSLTYGDASGISMISTVANQIELELSALSATTGEGEYLLIQNTGGGDGYSWTNFDLSSNTSTAIAELVASGMNVLMTTTTNGDLIMSVVESKDRILNIGDNYAVDASLVGDATNTITPIYTVVNGEYVLVSYDVLDSVDTVNIDQSATITVGSSTTGTDKNVLISDLNGANATYTLTLKGDGTAADDTTMTLRNDSATAVSGQVIAQDVKLQVESVTTTTATGSTTGLLTLLDLALNDSTLSVLDNSKLNVIDLAANGSAIDVAATGTLAAGTIDLDDKSSLTVAEGGTLSVDSLTAADGSTISGTVNLGSGTSTLSGSFSDATINAGSGTVATIDLSDAASLTVTGSAGSVSFTNAAGSSLASVNTTGTSLDFGTISDTVTLLSASSMNGGSLNFDLDDAYLGNTGMALFDVSAEGEKLVLTNTSVNIGLDGSSDIGSLSSVNGSYTLCSLGDDVVLAAGSSIVLSSDLAKYFAAATVVDGNIVASRNDSYYNSMSLTENGTAGLNLISKAFAATDLSDLVSSDSGVATIATTTATTSATGDMMDVYSDMDSYMASGSYAAADKLAAAVAGATTTSLGSAMMADVERQLRTTRNRTRSMGVDPTVVNQDMPYYNAWIAAEGSSSKLDSDSTHAGHSLSNTGGAVGVDVDLNDVWSVGASFTALIGDLDSDGADTAKGDFDTMYASVYARANKGRWNHSFAATYGMLDATLDRTVRGIDTAYTTKGDTSGNAFALMYEVGYTYAVTEDASTCIQPVFSVSMVNSNVDGYTETGSDATLKVGDQKNTYVTFGVGGVIETIVGEDIYNRASVFSGRVMLKADAGDRTSEADVSLTSNSGVTETVKGADVGSLGIELGVGLTIPVTEDVGAIFIDASCDLRSGMTSFSGTVGYRFSF